MSEYMTQSAPFPALRKAWARFAEIEAEVA